MALYFRYGIIDTSHLISIKYIQVQIPISKKIYYICACIHAIEEKVKGYKKRNLFIKFEWQHLAVQSFCDFFSLTSNLIKHV